MKPLSSFSLDADEPAGETTQGHEPGTLSRLFLAQLRDLARQRELERSLESATQRIVLDSGAGDQS